MDMGIVNAGALPLYTDVPEDLRVLCENAIWNLDPESTDKILLYAQTHGAGAKKEAESEQWREGSAEARIRHALVKGVDKHIVDDVEEARLNKEQVGSNFSLPISESCLARSSTLFFDFYFIFIFIFCCNCNWDWNDSIRDPCISLKGP